MYLKVFFVILILLSLLSCKEERSNTNNEYIFAPIGWHFDLPYNWVVQEDPEINKMIAKYQNDLSLNKEDIKKFKGGKLFFLKTNEGFNRFTSELHPFPESDFQFETHANDLIEQVINQLKGMTLQTEVRMNGSNDIKISGIIFKKSSIQFKFQENANDYFEMGVYIGRFKSNVLSISYTCVKGDEQCAVARDAIESSEFQKIK